MPRQYGQVSSSPTVRLKPSPRARSSTSPGAPLPWYSVNGARRKAVTLSLAISRLSLWVATPVSRRSRPSTRSGNSWPALWAATTPAARPALNSALKAA